VAFSVWWHTGQISIGILAANPGQQIQTVTMPGARCGKLACGVPRSRRYRRGIETNTATHRGQLVLPASSTF
jgi:hypothetical protein